MRKEFESPENLIDHVLEADVHFILGYLHHGILEYNQWSVQDFNDQLRRLRYHPGWPWGLNVDCCILTQDKFKYLTLCSSWSNNCGEKDIGMNQVDTTSPS